MLHPESSDKVSQHSYTQWFQGKCKSLQRFQVSEWIKLSKIPNKWMSRILEKHLIFFKKVEWILPNRSTWEVSEIGYPPHIFLVKRIIHSMLGKYVENEASTLPLTLYFSSLAPMKRRRILPEPLPIDRLLAWCKRCLIMQQCWEWLSPDTMLAFPSRNYQV